MIPKVIHYCWFGGNPLPELAKGCIESWKKYCPDYKIVEWNESNFDLSCCDYVKEAFQAKKWAFITDYVRLYALYNYGGIYMDTDVEVVKSLDAFLQQPAFSGFESDTQIPTGIMASEKGNLWTKRQLDYYTNRHFILSDGTLDLTTNVRTITNITAEYYPSLKLNNTYQELGDITFYPKDYFCPKDALTKEVHMTENTATIHHFNGSWIPPEERMIAQKAEQIGKKYNPHLGKLYSFVGVAWYRLKDAYRNGGIKSAASFFVKRAAAQLKRK